MNEHDARATPRKKLNNRANVVLADGKSFAGRTVDISQGGISIVLQEPIAAAQSCIILLELFAGDRVRQFNAPARVVYSICSGTAGFRIGFQFINLSPTNVEILNALFMIS